jgi:hypothetical protein
MDSPAMAFFEGLRPVADALARGPLVRYEAHRSGQIRTRPSSRLKPDGSGSTTMLLLSAHPVACQEIAHKGFCASK